MPTTIPPNRSKHAFTDIPPAPQYVNTSGERMGLLSHTLSPSPVVRWILPARIRSRLHNDVIFVGSTYIQLREFCDKQLSDPKGKLDIGTQILGAKVISAESKNVTTEDQISNQEWDEPGFIIKGAVCTDDQPPQILVLMTASNELIYVYGVSLPNKQRVELRSAKRALLHDVNMPEPGLNHMAIDPECKIMAVASRNTLTVFSLKDVDDLKKSIDAWDSHCPQSFQPHPEQRMLRIDGYIFKMEFIRASAIEPEKALLLLIVIKNGTSRLLMYRWDTRGSLDQIHALGGVPDLPPEDRFPVMLIPSLKRNSFILVSETSVTYYDELRTPSFQRYIAEGISAPSKAEQPLFAQWARPGRSDQYTQQYEDLLLVREDGQLNVLSRRIMMRHNTCFLPGRIDVQVDSAMCMLSQPRGMAGDILIVGGSLGDGGVYNLVPRDHYVKLQKIANISPIRDMLLLEPTISKKRLARTHRTFVTAGSSGTSTFNELHFGQEAQIGWHLDCPETETVNRLWLFEDVDTNKLYILLTFPEYTALLTMDLEDENQVDAIDESQALQLGFHLCEPTLAAQILNSKICVQITTKNVIASHGRGTLVENPVDECICAYIDVNGTFAVACKIDTGYYILVGFVGDSDCRPGICISDKRHLLTDRPMGLAVFNLGDKPYLCASYDDGRIEMFSIDIEGHLCLESTYRPSDNDTSPIASIVVVAHHVASMALLFAGTRAGRLKVLKLVPDANRPHGHSELILDRIYHIGFTPVVVAQENPLSTSTLSASITCGSRLDRIVCFRYDSQIDYMLTTVWFTYQNKLSYVSPNLSATQRVPYLESRSGGGLSGFLVCVTHTEIVFARLVEEEQMIPQRFGANEEGARPIGYSSLLRKFVIASDPVTGMNKQVAESCRRFPTLQVVDPNFIEDSDREPYRVILGDEKARVTVLLPWEPSDGKLHFDLIMVGLSGGASSRLGMISAKKLHHEHNTAVFKSIWKFGSKQIHAMSPFDRSSLVLGVGRQLRLLRLNITTRRWSEDGRYDLPSPAVSISTQGSTIYAATNKHSIIILKWHKTAKHFEKVSSDRVARNTKWIQPFGKNGDHTLVVIAPGQGTSIVGSAVKSNDVGASTPLFEAELPDIVEKVIPIPTSWKESSQAAFQAITFDGAVCILQTLTNNQWKLLRFIEQMATSDPRKPARRSASLMTVAMSRNIPELTRQERGILFDPKKMHIHGDVLKSVIEKGPESLIRLLGARVKNEDAMDIDSKSNSGMLKLEELAKPVIGDVDDVPTAVIVWIRKLLRATIF